MPTIPITPPRRQALEVLVAAGGDPVIIGQRTKAAPSTVGATSARWLIGEGYATEDADASPRTATLTEEGLAYSLELERTPGAEEEAGGAAPDAIADTFGAPPAAEEEAPASDGGSAFADIDTAATTTTVSGVLARISRPLHHREVITIVAQVEVTGLNFPATKHGITRRQGGAILDAFELGGKAGRNLINELKLAHDPSPLQFGAKADAAIAEAAILGATDGSGIVVTPSDREALGLAGAEGTVAIVWANGARCAWPDDFPPGAERPTVGEFVAIPGANDEHSDQVTDVLDMATGQPVAEEG